MTAAAGPLPAARLAAALIFTALLVAACAPEAMPTPKPADATPTPADATPTPAGATPTPADATPTPTPPAQPTPPDPTPTPTPTAVEPVWGPFAEGLGALTFLAHAGDGSGLLYALEQEGAIRVVHADGTVRGDPFLDIRDRVRAGGERGLLGLAFHPAYADNGRFFVNYTDGNGHTVVAEFARAGLAADRAADPATERLVMHIEQPFGNHNGGMLAFGPDGYLYVSTGDGGGAGDPLRAGQDLTTLLGKMLRIDVDGDAPYAIPPTNPFPDGAGGARPEIWAYGLRNPWRASFDRQTGNLFIADVGQGTWEEINAEPAGTGGLNYGWNIMEGPDCFGAATCDMSGLTMPVAWYPTRGDGHCAVTGGYVYRGSALPDLVGTYIFGDYCSGTIWGLDTAAAIDTGRAEMHELARSGISISAFGEDEQGELYAVGHGGQILRLSARPASPPQ